MAQSKEVFLSYGHGPEVDKFVTRLKSDLEEEGISVWRDKDNIPPGSNWPNMIGVGVYDCRALLCILTNKYVSSSDNCKRELDYALAQRKMVFPVLYETVDWKKNENAKGVSFVLGNIQRADFRPDKVDYQEALKNLVTAMKERGLGQAGTPVGGVGETPRGGHGETPGKGDTPRKGEEPTSSEQKVYERPGYLILLRKHVSRRVKDNVQGKAVLEGVGFDDATKARFFADNPNVEPAVQAGLTKWSGGQGRPPTWQVLCEAMEYADMEDSHIGDLKMALMNPTSALPGEHSQTLSQKVNDNQRHVMLFRMYVSRKAADKGIAVLEGVGLDAPTIAACFSASQNEEGAVQEGLTKWRGGKGFQPPTWGVLIEAIEYAQIEQQAIDGLKKELGL